MTQQERYIDVPELEPKGKMHTPEVVDGGIIVGETPPVSLSTSPGSNDRDTEPTMTDSRENDADQPRGDRLGLRGLAGEVGAVTAMVLFAAGTTLQAANGGRAHRARHLKMQNGGLNQKQPMPPEQKRLRRRKRR